MPVYREKKKIKIRDRSCGKELTYEKGGYGDCPKSMNELINFARDAQRACEGVKCPNCGSNDIEY